MSFTMARRKGWSPDWATHPGVHLAEHLEARGMSQAELARLAGLTPKLVSTIVSGHNPVTAETALRLERVLGLKAYIWTGLQANWDLSQAKNEESKSSDESSDIAALFPIAELKRRGALLSQRGEDTLDSLYSFLGIGNARALDARLASLAVHHRKTSKFNTSKYHVLAWLMLGENKVRQRRYPQYNVDAFLEAVRLIRALTVLDPSEFMPKLVNIAADAGVAVIIEPPLSKTCIYGSARWIDGETPVIQMSLRMKTNDHFWWTFFHECAHLVLHKGKTFADDLNGLGNELEDEADNWAEDALVGRGRFYSFRSTHPRSEVEVRSFARQVGIHPGIIVGMLQHSRVLPFTHLNGLKVSLDFAGV